MVSVSGETLRLAFSRSMPDMPGISRSVSSTATGSRRRSSSAWAPLEAVITRRPSRSSTFCSESAMPGSSSTTSTAALGSTGRFIGGGVVSVMWWASGSSSTWMPERLSAFR